MRRLTCLVCVMMIAGVAGLFAEPVVVRVPEATGRGFVRLRGPDGTALADGEVLQHRRGATITSRLTFRFHDRSLYDETTVFRQDREFRLISNHVVQRGPAFPQP